MELFLNLLWLMLALPAVLLWRQHSAFTQRSGRQSHARLFVLLGCLLALLFPIVSASDDLHPIRAEIEESGPFKRTVKQSTSVKSPARILDGGRDGGGLAPLLLTASFRPETETIGTVSEYLPVLPQLALAFSTIDGRAPPKA